MSGITIEQRERLEATRTSIATTSQEVADAFFTNGELILETMPQAYPDYERTGLKIFEAEEKKSQRWIDHLNQVINTSPDEYGTIGDSMYEACTQKHGKTVEPFFRNAPRVLKRTAKHYESYALIGRILIGHDEEAARLFLENAPQILEQTPQHYKRYVCTASYLIGNGSQAASPFLEKGARICHTLPEVFETFATTTIQMAKESPSLAPAFLDNMPEISYQDAGRFQDYVRTTLAMTRAYGLDSYQRLKDLQAIINGSAEKHQPVLLEAARRLAEKDLPTMWNLWDVAIRLQDAPAMTYHDSDDILIEAIRDQHSAHVVGQLLDKTKHGKTFANKVSTFY